MNLQEAAQGIVDALKAGGVRATLDPRDVNPPCVLVRPPDLAYRFRYGDWDATWKAWALTPDAGRGQVLKAFGPMLAAVQDALGGVVTAATPEDVTLPDGSTIPGYALSWTERIKITEGN